MPYFKPDASSNADAVSIDVTATMVGNMSDRRPEINTRGDIAVALFEIVAPDYLPDSYKLSAEISSYGSEWFSANQIIPTGEKSVTHMVTETYIEIHNEKGPLRANGHFFDLFRSGAQARVYGIAIPHELRKSKNIYTPDNVDIYPYLTRGIRHLEVLLHGLVHGNVREGMMGQYQFLRYKDTIALSIPNPTNNRRLKASEAYASVLNNLSTHVQNLIDMGITIENSYQFFEEVTSEPAYDVEPDDMIRGTYNGGEMSSLIKQQIDYRHVLFDIMNANLAGLREDIPAAKHLRQYAPQANLKAL